MSTLSDRLPGLEGPEPELQLGLGLGVGGCLGLRDKAVICKPKTTTVTTPSCSPCSGCSSTSSSSLGRAADASAGVKRSADSAADNTGVINNQVVGWPPVRTYRISSMGNPPKSAPSADFSTIFRSSKSKTPLTNNSLNGSDGVTDQERVTISPFVKVNMDGYPIGRKVDLTCYNSYEGLAQTLEDMFVNSRQSTSISIGSDREKSMTTEARTTASKLLAGSSEFALTYEDKEGDWMLVGDVPWRMFLNSVKRLRIMRMSNANASV
uniref:Auxin-responsive protein n=1 Tax=Kalanchoe fedtschenkoi TaxID=63787 RepID=A0A7N0T886_KALFE